MDEIVAVIKEDNGVEVENLKMKMKLVRRFMRNFIFCHLLFWFDLICKRSLFTYWLDLTFYSFHIKMLISLCMLFLVVGWSPCCYLTIASNRTWLKWLQVKLVLRKC